MLFCYNLNMLRKQHNFIGNFERHIMSKTEKLFTVAGTATHNDVTKARFANDLVARIKILHKAGATNINLVELPNPMTKLEALRYLQTQGITDGDANYAVANKLAEKSKVAKKGEVTVQATKGVKATAGTPKTASAKSKVSEATNA